MEENECKVILYWEVSSYIAPTRENVNISIEKEYIQRKIQTPIFQFFDPLYLSVFMDQLVCYRCQRILYTLVICFPIANSNSGSKVKTTNLFVVRFRGRPWGHWIFHYIPPFPRWFSHINGSDHSYTFHISLLTVQVQTHNLCLYASPPPPFHPSF